MGVHTCHFFNRTKCSPSSFSFSSEFDPSQYVSRFFFLFTHATFFECALVSFEFVYSFTPFMRYSRQSNYQLINTEINCVSSAWPYGLMSGCPAVISSPPSLWCYVSPCPLKGLKVSWKKNTKLWIQFNLVSAMKNNLQARRVGSGNADMFQSIFSD